MSKNLSYLHERASLLRQQLEICFRSTALCGAACDRINDKQGSLTMSFTLKGVEQDIVIKDIDLETNDYLTDALFSFISVYGQMFQDLAVSREQELQRIEKQLKALGDGDLAGTAPGG